LRTFKNYRKAILVLGLVALAANHFLAEDLGQFALTKSQIIFGFKAVLIILWALIAMHLIKAKGCFEIEQTAETQSIETDEAKPLSMRAVLMSASKNRSHYYSENTSNAVQYLLFVPALMLTILVFVLA